MYERLFRAARAAAHPAVQIRASVERGAGVYVTRPVEEGAVLLSVPHSALITARAAPPRPASAYSGFEKYQLALALAAGDGEVVAALRDALGTPPRNGMALLPKHFHTQQYKTLCRTWRGMADALAEDGVGSDAAVRALSHVLSRAITFDKRPTLMPVLDLLNHAAAPSASLLSDEAASGGDGRLCVVASHAIDADAEVTIKYHAAPATDEERDFWLFTWGFVPM